MSIVELRQTAENEWKAKYQGNYGLYTIRITTDGKKTVKFSCSCPSDYNPCKHIPMIEEAIAERIADGMNQGKYGGLKIEKVMRNATAEELKNFIIKQTKYNDDLYNAVFLEFTAGVKNTGKNKYSGIIREALASAPVLNEDSYHYEKIMDLDILDKWIDKAKDYAAQEQYDEAILVCKACIEEYSQWLYNADEETYTAFNRVYQTVPFTIFEDAVRHANQKELLDYCLSEIKKDKYVGTGFYEGFQRLFATLALKVDPDTFLAFQDQLLANIADKNSHTAETILRRKVDFYQRLGRNGKALAILEENIQINSFRLEVVERKIAKKDFEEAKRLINDFFMGEGDREHHLYRTYRKLLLDIAQKENDVPVIKELAYGFIKDNFKQEYYEIYKAVFDPDEWADEREKLFLRYSDQKYFADSAANLLAAEADAERLMHYVEKYISSENLVRYYKSFATAYSEKALELFKRVVVSYAEQNVGRSHYEYVVSLLKKMWKIEGGKEVVSELVAAFRIRYKGRKAMLEILQQL